MNASLRLAVDRDVDRRYRILAPLGSGGTSRVYLAHDSVLGKDVAMKVLDERAASDGRARSLFLREARALAKISHPNVIAVHDVGEVDGLPYLVMDRIAGGSLKERIERGGPLPVAEAIAIATQLANGLAFAHSRGIVHADLKPSNVLLGEDGGARICDFGIARLPRDGADDGARVYATALYVAPERAEGQEPTAASDIYGLGLVLYEMLVGKPPFTSSDPTVLLRDHALRQPVPPSYLRPSLPRQIDQIVLRCLAKRPADRYAHASDVAVHLAELAMAGVDERAPATPVVPELRAPARSGWVAALLGAYGDPARRTLVGTLAAVPAFAVLQLTGADALPALAVAAVIGIVALVGQVAVAVALAWVVATFALFLLMPALALLFAAMGIWSWLRDVPPERAAVALAIPALAPLGLAPALALAAAAIFGLSGVMAVSWGTVLAVLYAVCQGRQTIGPFVQTGIALEPPALLDTARAAATRDALLYLLHPVALDDRTLPLRTVLDPAGLAAQALALASRLATADVAAVATVLAWTLAAAVVWIVGRAPWLVLGAHSDRATLTLRVIATAGGLAAGAAVLYLAYVTFTPLSDSPGRAASAALLTTAASGALIALVVSILAGTTRRPAGEEVFTLA